VFSISDCNSALVLIPISANSAACFENACPVEIVSAVSWLLSLTFCAALAAYSTCFISTAVCLSPATFLMASVPRVSTVTAPMMAWRSLSGIEDHLVLTYPPDFSSRYVTVASTRPPPQPARSHLLVMFHENQYNFEVACFKQTY